MNSRQQLFFFEQTFVLQAGCLYLVYLLLFGIVISTTATNQTYNNGKLEGYNTHIIWI